ncbi:hypothetical protein GQ651_00510 [Alphaproteobacteria bacterium GH1-50]|uniref:Uncharacterized protein n=1 Tax=Kangsaoukella pontilimi TaxID=2691042 RepID=A0A7C9MD95_9RHOB|nr:anti-sigma factor [Kangsaoukella pontilimi]MXQ06316.1 hypothetical protein [Kangsaoukella pontilimi]
MTDDKRDDPGLDLLFQTARQAPAAVPDGLWNRIAADIDGLPSATPTASRPAPRRRLFEWLTAAGSLTAATAVGVVIGLNSGTGLPAGLSFVDTESYDLSAFIAGADPSVFYLGEDSE